MDERARSMTCGILEIAKRERSALVIMSIVLRTQDGCELRPRRPVTGAMPGVAWELASDMVAMSTRGERALCLFRPCEIVSQSKCILKISITRGSTI